MAYSSARRYVRLADCARAIEHVPAPDALLAAARLRADTLERKKRLLPPPPKRGKKRGAGKQAAELSGAYIAAVAGGISGPLDRLAKQLSPLCLPSHRRLPEEDATAAAAAAAAANTKAGLHPFDAALVEVVAGRPAGFASHRQWLRAASTRVQQLGAKHAATAAQFHTASEAAAARSAGLEAISAALEQPPPGADGMSVSRRLLALIDEMTTLRRLPDVRLDEPIAVVAAVIADAATLTGCSTNATSNPCRLGTM